MTDLLNLLKVVTAIAAASVFLWGVLVYRKQSKGPQLPLKTRIVTPLMGFIANALDTLGLGSFAVLIAGNEHFKFMDENRLAGTLNYHCLLACLAQALIFLQMVEIDLVTLFVLVAGPCVGAYISSLYVSNISRQTVRAIMGCAFLGTGLVVLGSQLHLLPVGGEAIALSGGKLVVAFIGMVLAGMLPSVGVGFYAPVQAFLFFLGMSPLAAFPIMTTSSTLQQSLTAATFLRKGEIDLRCAIPMGIAGIFGVFLAAPLVATVDKDTLRWLLATMVFYNAFNAYRAYRKNQPAAAVAASESLVEG